MNIAIVTINQENAAIASWLAAQDFSGCTLAHWQIEPQPVVAEQVLDAYYGFHGERSARPLPLWYRGKKYMRTGPLMLRRKPVFTPLSLWNSWVRKSDNGQISSDPAGDKVCTAVVSDGKISQLMLEPDTADSLLGNIYIGKVQKVVSNINAAFIDIGPGCTGYYSLQERWKPERIKTGDELVVQVSKDAVKSKAPVVTERLSFTGRYCVLTVGKTGIGFFRENP